MQKRKQNPALTSAALVKLRETTKLNQTEFWTRIGVTQSGGSRYENGRAIPKPVQLLIRLAYGGEAESGELVRVLRGGLG